VVPRPDRQAAPGDRLGHLHLGPQEGGDDLSRKEGGAQVHPGVLVDLAEREPAAVRPLLADHLGARDQPRVVDEQGATFAAQDVLGLMEAQSSERAEPAQRPALVAREYRLGRVLDDEQPVPGSDRLDLVHLARHPA
jgi:hypothetical protein